ncbi:hypothetical protein Trydic_g19675 [Trypoxylus dichotomus]
MKNKERCIVDTTSMMTMTKKTCSFFLVIFALTAFSVANCGGNEAEDAADAAKTQFEAAFQAIKARLILINTVIVQENPINFEIQYPRRQLQAGSRSLALREVRAHNKRHLLTVELHRVGSSAAAGGSGGGGAGTSTVQRIFGFLDARTPHEMEPMNGGYDANGASETGTEDGRMLIKYERIINDVTLDRCQMHG